MTRERGTAEPITRTDVRTSIAEKLRGNNMTAGVARPKEQPEKGEKGDPK